MRSMLAKINFKNNKLFTKKNIIVISVSLFLVLLAIILIPKTFAQPVKNVEIISASASFGEKEPGAWKVNKSAKWTSKGEAEITFDVDTIFKSKSKYTDVIFVLDVSASMNGDKLTRVKSDATELVNYLLENNKNRVGLITFESASQLVLNLTNNKEQITETINQLETGNTTNYYQALVNVDKVLKNYIAEDDKDCTVLFLTDGYPNVDNPNEVAQYNYLKTTYPFITVNGIQYEMGDVVLNPIKEVSDYQYIADRDNLHNVLFDAAVTPVAYENFEITDFIDTNYFTVNSESDIKVSEGSIILNQAVQTVNWKIDSLKSGSKATMTINAKLKDELIGKGGVYPTNEKEIIKSKIQERVIEETSTKTPILADNYKVRYEVNAPEGCKVTGTIPNEETKSVFDIVALSKEEPKCEGYEFKGWAFVTSGVEKVNDDYFIMPEADVELKATWGRLKIEKSMEGEVSVIQTFYKMMKEQAVPDDEKSIYVTSSTGIDFGKAPSDTNGRGVYLRTPTKNDEYPVLYYRGEVNDNNVKFANFCWKIVRTTETGGVKLIYNGEPDVDGNCTATGESTQIGKSKFNQNSNSPADVGYMYGNRDNYVSNSQLIPRWYSHIGRSLENEHILSNASMHIGYDYYYGDSIEWDTESMQYILKNSDGSEVVQTEWGSEANDSLKGKYRCALGTATSCETVYYIITVGSSEIIYKALSNNQTLEDVNKVWNYGSEVIYENGVYTIQNPAKVQELDWHINHPESGNYMCPDGGVSCSKIYYLESFLYSGERVNSSYRYITMENGETYDSLYQEALDKKWIYGNDVEWDGSKYILKDTYESNPLNWDNDYKTIATKYHYTCFSTEDNCIEVKYIHYFYNEDYTNHNIYHLNFRDGKKLEDAKAEMFANTTDSAIKQTIDIWYQAHMLDYTDKLEDTVWCNDRSIDRGPLKSKDEDSSDINYKTGNNYTYFGATGRNVKTYVPSVECENINDRFTVNAENGNGMLTYPVALLTADELTLAGHGQRGYSSSSYLFTNQFVWALSPGSFNNYGAYGFRVDAYLDDSYSYIYSTLGVRPSISLAPGTIIASGDGTATNPYTVLME